MRIAGWILLLAGLILCVSIAWAPLGFLLMGIGLISLQVAEQNRRRATHAAVAGVESFVPMEAIEPPRAEAPEVHREIAPAPARDVARRARPAASTYDREAWRQLVESDPDLSQLTEVLADFGQQYVDELATNYLAAPDKSRLGAIVDGIVAKAGRANRLRAADPPEDSKPSIASRREPDVAGSSNDSHLDLLPAQAPTTPLTEVEVPIATVAAAAPAQPASDPPPVDPPKPDRERWDAPSVDDDLTDMIKKFAPDSSFLRKH